MDKTRLTIIIIWNGTPNGQPTTICSERIASIWYFCDSILVWVKKGRKKANIRNRYNQVPHLTQNTLWESEKYKKTSKTEVLRGELSGLSPYI